MMLFHLPFYISMRSGHSGANKCLENVTARNDIFTCIFRKQVEKKIQF